MEIDDGVGAFFGLQEGHVLPVIHEEVLGQDCRAAGVADDVEVFLDVGISIGMVAAQVHIGQPGLRCFIQAGGQGVGLGLPSRRETAPAPGLEPIFAVPGGVDVDGEENHLVSAELSADGVYAPAALSERDVFLLRNDEVSIKMKVEEMLPDLAGDEAGVSVFAEEAVGASLARSFNAVAIVEEDLHSYWV